MKWNEYRRLMLVLNRTPVSEFHTTKWGDSERFSRWICGTQISIVARGKERYVEYCRDRIGGATKLYRRINGVRGGDVRFALGEAILIPCECWRWNNNGDSWEFSYEHKFFRRLTLKAVLTGDKVARLYCSGLPVAKAEKLYRRLVDYATKLSEGLAHASWWKDPNNSAMFHCSLSGTHYSIEQTVGPLKVETIYRLCSNDRVISDDRGLYELWMTAYESAKLEQEKENSRSLPKRERKPKDKKHYHPDRQRERRNSRRGTRR